jgi:predicted TIM-barrel fold metal-dependent hydrolase
MKNGFLVVDCDAHMQEPLDIWQRYVEPKFRDRAPKVIGAAGRLIFNYAPCEAFPEGLTNMLPESVYEGFPERMGEAYDSWWSLSSRLKHMDQEGIDVMVCFPSNGTHATSLNITDPALQAALCRAYNDWATDYCRDSNDRVKFVAKLSVLNVSDAVAEVKRVQQRPEVAAFVLPDLNDNDRLWHGAEFDPLWAAVCDSDLSVGFHGGMAQFRWFRAYRQQGLAAVGHALGFPIEEMAAVGTIIFGGVLERFPQLRIGLYEGNVGWVPWWLARLDEHASGRQERFNTGNRLTAPPSEQFKRSCFVSSDADEGTLPMATQMLDGNNIMFNSDYPHVDSGFPGSVGEFVERPLSEDAKRKILWDNPVRLYSTRVIHAPVPV